MTRPTANPSPAQPTGVLHALAQPGGLPAQPDTSPGSEALLRKNLEVLARRSPHAVRAIEEAGPGDHLRFFRDAEGRWCAAITQRGITRQMCSFKDAAAEARRWAAPIDVAAAAAIVVRGFGCGHHLRKDVLIR